jgi:hypothetical protein
MPFVFRAYGDVHIDPRPPCSPSEPNRSPTPLPTPAPPPPRIFPAYKCPTSSATTQHARPTAATASDPTRPSDGPGYTDVDSSSSSDEDDFDGGLNTRVWNHTGAFPRFLSLVRAHALSTSSTSSSPSPSPSVPPSPSSPVRPSSSPTATRGMRRFKTMPYTKNANAGGTSSSGSSGGSNSSTTSLSLPRIVGVPSTSSPPSPARSLPSLTPAPARVRTRYRVARAARRLLGLTERGLESAAAEEADVVEGRVQGQSSKKGFKGDGRKEKGHAGKERDRVVRTTKSGGAAEDSEVWNPFAHLKNASS